MSKISYIEEINAFERWLETNHLPPASQLLWYKLIALFNRCGWSEWITVDNPRLMGLLKISREATFIEIRNKLIESGLIEYQKGKKGSPNRYRMLFFTFKIVVQSEVQTVVQSEVYTEVQTVVQTADINRLDKTKTNLKEITKENADCPKVGKGGAEVQAVYDLFNKICTRLNPVSNHMNYSREKETLHLIENYDLDFIASVFTRANASDFLCGKGAKGFKADYDWIINRDKFVVISEGKYDNRGSPEESKSTSYDIDDINEFWNKVPTL